MAKTNIIFRHLFAVCMGIALLSILTRTGYGCALLVVVVIGWLCYQKTIPHFTIILFILGLLIRLVVMIWVQPPLESDFLTLYNAAQKVLVGDNSFQHIAYYTLWAYQTAFVLWEAFWLNLWNDPNCLKLVHAVLASGTVCLLYRIIRCYSGDRAARGAVLLLTVLPFGSTWHVVLSNQIPSAFFFVLGLWLLACEDCYRLGFLRFPLTGAVFQIGNLLRCEGVILLVAVAAWSVFEVLTDKKSIKRLMAGVLVLVTVYGAAGGAADWAVRATGWNRNGLKNGIPIWKLVCGMNMESEGGYSGTSWTELELTLNEQHQATEETQRTALRLIRENGPHSFEEVIAHFGAKIKRLWCGDALYWAYREKLAKDPDAKWYTCLLEFNLGVFCAAFMLALLGLLKLHRRSTAAYLPYFVCFSSFCAFLIVEAQPRYVYLPQLFVFAASACGLEHVLAGCFLPRDGEKYK